MSQSDTRTGSVDSAPAEPRIAALDANSLAQLALLERSTRPGMRHKLFTIFREHSDQLLTQADRCAEAADWNGLRIALHTLKSSALNVGAGVMGAAAAKLEACAQDGHWGREAQHQLRSLRPEYDAVVRALERELERPQR